MAAGRFMELSTFDTAAWTEQLRSILRHAQKVAIAQNQRVYVHLAPGRVAVCLDSDAACAVAERRVRAPGGANSGSAPTRAACGSSSWMCEAPPAGVTMRRQGETGAAIGGVAFDGLGRAAMIDGFGGRLEIKGDELTNIIIIDPETGYVD
jgi:MSHA pilin protein MshC